MSFFKKIFDATKACAKQCFEAVFPVLLLAQAVVPMYLIGGRMMKKALLAHENKAHSLWSAAAGRRVVWPVFMFAFLCFLWLLWVIPLGYCLYSSYWVALRRKETAASQEPIFEVDGDSKMRLVCRYCRGLKHDRSYHCHKRFINKCLPFYDHTCYWWTGVIWLHDLKAYLLMITMLPIYQLYILVVSIWILASQNKERNPHFWAPIGIISVLGLGVSISVTWEYWQSFVFRNTLARERDRGIYFLNENDSVCYWKPTGEPADVHGNPYNMGVRRNAHDMLGPWYTWLFFWTNTPLMDKVEGYRQVRGYAFKEILLEPLRPVHPRSQGSSTGFDDFPDIESGKLNRRKGRHTYP